MRQFKRPYNYISNYKEKKMKLHKYNFNYFILIKNNSIHFHNINNNKGWGKDSELHWGVATFITLCVLPETIFIRISMNSISGRGDYTAVYKVAKDAHTSREEKRTKEDQTLYLLEMERLKGKWTHTLILNLLHYR